MMCARCEELEEEVAYLKAELGQADDLTSMDRLRTAIRVRSHASRATGLISALYGAKGRVLSTWAILEAVPPRIGGEDDRNPDIVKVWVSAARKGLGYDAIENAWGRGYRMTDIGMARVREILAGSEPGAVTGRAA